MTSRTPNTPAAARCSSSRGRALCSGVASALSGPLSLPAGAAAVLVPVARALRLLFQRLRLLIGMDLMLEERGALPVLEGYDHGLFQRQHFEDAPFTQGSDHAFVLLGEGLARLGVLFVFVHQAAAQAAAHPRDLLRVERDPLRLGHLDRDAADIGPKHRAEPNLEPEEA